MDNKRLYVDFHIIQTVPPSCINRDDIGRPKTAVYGGAVRSRVSSQSWKHAMRAMFSDIFGEDNQGFRTKHAVKLIADKIQVKDVSVSAEEAEKKAAKTLNTAGIKTNEKKDNQTGCFDNGGGNACGCGRIDIFYAYCGQHRDIWLHALRCTGAHTRIGTERGQAHVA